MSLSINETYQTGSATGPTIVFLHGLGVSSWMWQEQVAALSDQFRCITIDLPGLGDSQESEWKSMADSAAQVAQVIKQQSTEGKAHVVGLSLGGYVALHLFADFPECVESVIVSGVTPLPFKRQWMWRGMINAITPLLHWGPMIYANASAMQLPAEAVPLFHRDMKRLSKATFRAIYKELLNFNLPVTLSDRSQRLLAVAGDKEAKLIIEGLPKFAALNAKFQAAIVPNAHHGWNGEHPALFSDMIRSWVTGQRLPVALHMV